MFEVFRKTRLDEHGLMRPFAVCVAAFVVATILSGCATTVQVTARFPARNPEAADLRKIAVANFEGPDGTNFAGALEAALASAQFDGAQYFTVVDSGHRAGQAEARAAAAYGRSVGAQGVFFGRVELENVRNEGFQGLVMACIANDANGNCAKWGMVQVPCVRRIVEMSVLPTLVKVATGQVVYSSRKSASADTSWCQGQEQSVSDDALVAAARARILNDIRVDVAPYNAVLQATIKESNDGLPDDAAKLFDSAVANAKKNDLGEACRIWAEVDKMSPNHAWTVYDLGVCAETNGDYVKAFALYQRARTLAPRADSDVAASISRAQQLIGAHDELKREQKVRDDQTAAIRRQTAEQERQQQAQARAAKAALDAKHAQLVAKFGAPTAALIEAHQVRAGMTTAAVIASRGMPGRREKVPPDSELWHYGSMEVGFTKGKVTHVSQ